MQTQLSVFFSLTCEKVFAGKWLWGSGQHLIMSGRGVFTLHFVSYFICFFVGWFLLRVCKAHLQLQKVMVRFPRCSWGVKVVFVYFLFKIRLQHVKPFYFCLEHFYFTLFAAFISSNFPYIIYYSAVASFSFSNFLLQPFAMLHRVIKVLLLYTYIFCVVWPLLQSQKSFKKAHVCGAGCFPSP